ncbi:hypothetical protein LOTGIDRAFT_194080 [Lottia gigantea]|uniref:3-oxo-5alpha-steroid 4-dehydrogenase (NADP(+)) n=1 Tax=Lottia gigantea TaxID=225164 RepID=V3ZTF2_LOTGI|nr:hypothetical protein LOTGIDRAFT_194080 [Lottia gigantea]ESO87652.1 hypothetical protein LOTGIDRAFT_194080 [Lottia gigantea]
MIRLLWKDDMKLLDYICYMYLVNSVFVVFMLTFVSAPYGRYSRGGWGFTINAKVAWFIQEVPSILIPIGIMLYTDCPKLQYTPNRILISLFSLHYIQRSLVYPFLIKGGKPTPLIPFLLALVFCTINGYLQFNYLAKYADYGNDWFSLRFIAGVMLFFTGMFINLQSDSILRNLRKPGETGYKIPKGGMFEYVSGANFLGEIIEWCGFALSVWASSAAVFACFTICNIGPRALQHHRWYQKKFDNYPAKRKALIPFIL